MTSSHRGFHDRDGSFSNGGDSIPPISAPGLHVQAPGLHVQAPGLHVQAPLDLRPYTNWDESSMALSTPLAESSHARALRTARSTVLNCTELYCTVDVDDSSVSRGGSKGEISALADRAALVIWPSGPPPSAAGTMLAAAAAATVLPPLNETWLMESAKQVRTAMFRTARKVDDPLLFLVGTLRVNAFKIARLPRFATREEGRDWIGAVLWAFEEKVAPWLPPPPKPVSPPVEDLAAQQEAARREAAEDLHAQGHAAQSAQSSKLKAQSPELTAARRHSIAAGSAPGRTSAASHRVARRKSFEDAKGT